MRKAITLCLSLMLAAGLLTGCAASAEQHTGEAQGYGGPLRVSVSMNGSDIMSVEVISHSETEGVGTRAIDVLPDRIAQADSVNVDSVSGATFTSEAIKAAVSQAIGGAALPESIDMNQNGATGGSSGSSTPLRKGMGMAATGRLGPGTDENGEQVYSFNVVFACGSFDEQGRVVSLDVDQLEVLSSQFGGFPSGSDDEERFLSEVAGWTTKGAKGDDYMLTSASWRQQMDAYQDMMTGKTIDEINAWFSQNFSAETGKPQQNAGNTTSGDESAATGSTQTETITGATMSLRDEHGDILTAIQRAWENAQSRSSSGTGEGGEGNQGGEGGMLDTNTQTDVTDGENSMG